MPDVDMKDTGAAAKTDPAGAAEETKGKSTRLVPITIEDITRNVALIVRAVETKQTRLTTRAISR